eukprot:GHVN01106676.1.p2 GENE.GHVN01106676.1~~GHVN01106676.1.p2  ORF type:complete len:109 (+),score=13.99 GHVN01106676.1:489-815(+)
MSAIPLYPYRRLIVAVRGVPVCLQGLATPQGCVVEARPRKKSAAKDVFARRPKKRDALIRRLIDAVRGVPVCLHGLATPQGCVVEARLRDRAAQGARPFRGQGVGQVN